MAVKFKMLWPSEISLYIYIYGTLTWDISRPNSEEKFPGPYAVYRSVPVLWSSTIETFYPLHTTDAAQTSVSLSIHPQLSSAIPLVRQVCERFAVILIVRSQGHHWPVCWKPWAFVDRFAWFAWCCLKSWRASACVACKWDQVSPTLSFGYNFPTQITR